MSKTNCAMYDLKVTGCPLIPSKTLQKRVPGIIIVFLTVNGTQLLWFFGKLQYVKSSTAKLGGLQETQWSKLLQQKPQYIDF